MQRRCGSSTARRAVMWLAGLSLGLACIDLTPPPEVVDFRNGVVSSTGGQVPIETGGVGGLPGSGGATMGGTVGAGGATASGGATSAGGLTGAGGATGLGGSTTSPAGTGGARFDAGLPDVAVGTGGVIATGGTTGTGGKQDGAADAGDSEPDAPAGTGGAQGSGGAPGSGGATVGSGGRTGSGGAPGTGGVTGTGGSTSGTGGKTGSGGAVGTGGSTGYNNCSSPIVPANGSNGMVTNFTDWNSSTSRWGSGALTGNVYAYVDPNGGTTAVKVEGTPPGLHLTGTVTSWGGAGLTFLSCATVASFTKLSFDVYGQAAGCTIELQLQTFAERPTDQTPPGGCASDCFGFPVKSQVVDLATAVTTPRTVSVTLNTMTSWAASAATQIVGIQWQFTGGSCTPNATFTNIKFVP